MMMGKLLVNLVEMKLKILDEYKKIKVLVVSYLWKKRWKKVK